MKTLYYCIRCHSLRDGQKKFTASEIASIYLAKKLGIEIKLKTEVCFKCRQGIGDEVANEMLKGVKDENQEKY